MRRPPISDTVRAVPRPELRVLALFAFGVAASAVAPGFASAQTPAPPTTQQAGAEAEWAEWQAATERQRAEREAVVRERLQGLSDAALAGEDRAELEQLIQHIQAASPLDEAFRRQMLLPLRDRRIELLARDARVAIARRDVDASHALLETALSPIEGLSPPSASLVALLAQVQADHVGALAASAEQVAAGGAPDRARALLERARAVAPAAGADGGSGAATRAAARLESAQVAVERSATTSTLVEGREAEAQHDLGRALRLYRAAGARGADVQTAIARVEAQRRSPFVEAGMSFVVPGLGQLTHGRPLEGALFLGGTGIALVGGLLLNASAEDRYDRYQAATDPSAAAELYDGIQGRWRGALVLFGTATVLHLWNVYDAYADARQFNLTSFR